MICNFNNLLHFISNSKQRTKKNYFCRDLLYGFLYDLNGMGNMNSVKDNKEKIVKFFNDLPFNKKMGIRLVSVGEGLAEMTVDYNRNLIGDKKTMVIHGGVVTTLLDAACGAAVMSAGEPKVPTATIDLRIDYLRSAQPKAQITARAECFRITPNVAFVRATAHDGNDEVPVASASGAFTSPI